MEEIGEDQESDDTMKTRTEMMLIDHSQDQ